jgi:hypothetical protein
MLSSSPKSSQRGQILPLGLAFLFGACLGLLLFVNLGRLLVLRERHRMQADLTAHAGAVDLARCLNVAAALNKAQLALFTLLSFAETPLGAWATHITTSRYIDTGVKAAAALPEASVAYVGLLNGLKPFPLWSKGGDGQPSLLPSLNLTRRYANNLFAALAELAEGDKDGEPPPGPDPTSTARDRYTYTQKDSGQEVSVDASQVQRVIFRENGRWRSELRKRDPLSGKVKFIKDNGLADPFPLDLVETGPTV